MQGDGRHQADDQQQRDAGHAEKKMAARDPGT